VGRLQRANPKLTDEISTALTKEERKEVAAWIEGYATVGGLKRELRRVRCMSIWRWRRNGSRTRRAKRLDCWPRP